MILVIFFFGLQFFKSVLQLHLKKTEKESRQAQHKKISDGMKNVNAHL